MTRKYPRVDVEFIGPLDAPVVSHSGLMCLILDNDHRVEHAPACRVYFVHVYRVYEVIGNIWIVVRCNQNQNTVRDIRVCTVKSMTLINIIKYVKPTVILAAHIYLLQFYRVISTSLSGAPAGICLFCRWWCNCTSEFLKRHRLDDNTARSIITVLNTPPLHSI